MQKFKIVGKPLLGENYVHEERKRIMPSLVATMSASACTTFVRTHSARTNYDLSPEMESIIFSS